MSGPTVPVISLADFDARRPQIVEQLMKASNEVGFFTLSDHGIPQEDIDGAFALSKSFFALPDDVKGKTPHNGKNMGWEKNSQIRPSTGTADCKESIQFARMEGCWPSDEDLPGFRAKAERFMHQIRDLSVKVMECFADGLGLPHDIFTEGTVDPGVGDSQSTLRLLHYHAMDGASSLDRQKHWRAGAHTDFDVLTMLLQRAGEGGLEVCAGREAVGDFAVGSVWSPVVPQESHIVCNIGDQLMRWSDDKLKSNFHRVKLPGPEDPQGPRYSIAFFNQARSGTVIQGPGRKYEPITGAEFIAEAMARNKLAVASAPMPAADKSAAITATSASAIKATA